jgi:5S rRNA maturation endonuclease (ribonuclease M5)
MTLKQTIAQVKFPEVLPKKMLNKEICGNIKVYKSDFYGKIDYTYYCEFDYKITISETEGIFVEYNPGQRWNDDSRNGTTQKISNFELWKQEDKINKDRYGDVVSSEIHYLYKVYSDYNSNHYIKDLIIIKGKTETWLKLILNVPLHQDAIIYVKYDGNNIASNICGYLKSVKELELEKEAARKEKERKEKEIAELRLKENIQKIDNVKAKINLGNINEAQLMFNEIDLTQPYTKDQLADLQYCKLKIEEYLKTLPTLDSLTTIKINQAVLSKDSSTAIKLFFELKLENSKKQVSNSLIGIIRGTYSKSAVNISENKQEIYRLLKQITNSNQITQITNIGLHRLYITVDGNVIIDSINTSFNIKPYQENFFGTYITRPAFCTFYVSTYSYNRNLGMDNVFLVEVPEEIKEVKMSPVNILDNLYALYNRRYTFKEVYDLGYWPKIYYMSTGNSWPDLQPLKKDIQYVKVNPSLKSNQVNLIYGQFSFLTYQSPYNQDLILNVVVDKVVSSNKSKITFK